MDTNRENMQEFFTSLETRFKAGMEAVRSPRPGHMWLEDVAMSAQVSGGAVVHAWLTQLPGMRKWLGDRVIDNLLSGKLTVANDDFEATVAVPRNDIEDDNYGLYGNLAQALGTSAENLWTDLAIAALVGNGNWADGAAFFGTSRKYGDSLISNKTTSALDATTFGSAVEAMMSYRGHKGVPLKVMPTKLVVGPKLRTTAFAICKAANFVQIVTNKVGSENVGAASVDNPNLGIVEPVISANLVGDQDDYWYLIGEVNGIKPVMVQQRRLPKFVSLDRETDENVFMRKEFLYGTDARGAAFLTLPHLAYAGIL